MKRRVAFALSAALLLVSGWPGRAQTGGQEIIRQSVAALGGEQALRALKTLRIAGEAKWWDPDQSVAAGGPALFVGDTAFTLNWDLAGGKAHSSLVRTSPMAGRVRLQEVFTPQYGFVADDEATRPMSGIRVAAQLRELRRVAPDLVIRMLDNPDKTVFEGGVRTADGIQPGFSFKDGGSNFTVIFSRKTHLPAIVRTQDDDAVRGTVNYEVRFDDWKSVAGVKIAHQLTYTLSDAAIGRVRYSAVEVNPALDSAQFVAPEAIRTSLRAPANGNVPFQWIIRRLAAGAFLDSDQVFVPQGGSLKLVELAPNVMHVVGGSHNNLIVNMSDGVVVFDAPVSNEQSRWVLKAAREKFGKPVKHLVLTHHHGDSVAGARLYMAEGASLLVPVPDKKYFVKAALAEHVVADELQIKRRSVDISEIKDVMVLKDGETEIRLMRIPNHHADGMLIAHILPANIVYVTDLYSPGIDLRKTNGLLSFNDALRRIGIRNATIAGGHGGTAPQSALEAIADAR